MARTLRTSLRLDALLAKREADQVKSKLRGVGTEGTKAMTGVTGAAGVLGKAIGPLGLLGGLTAVYKIMRDVYQQQILINRAEAEAYRLQQQRIRGQSQALGGQLYREVFDVTGWLPKEAHRRALQATRSFDVTPEGYLEAAKRLYARMPKVQVAAAAEDAMKFATARGLTGGTAGSILPLMTEQYGLTTQAQWRGGLAQIGAVAEKSAWTTSEFGSQLSRVAAPMRGAGVTTLGGQLAWLSAFSLFAPDRPELGGRALEMMSQLSLQKKNAFMRKLLTEAGKSPTTNNLDDIRVAITKYLREGGEGAINELNEQMSIPKRVLRRMQQAATGAWETKHAESLQLAKGATWETDVEARFKQWMKGKLVPERGAAAVGQLSETEMGEPGTSLEAQAILGRTMSHAAGAKGFQQGVLDLGDRIRREHREGWPHDEPPTAEHIRKLATLNGVYNLVRPALVKVLGRFHSKTTRHAWGGGQGYSLVTTPEVAGVPRTGANRNGFVLTGTGVVGAEWHIRAITAAHEKANNWQLWGTQAERIDGFEIALRNAIRFLQQLQLGQQIAYPEDYQRLGGPGMKAPQGETIQRGGAAVEEMGMPLGIELGEPAAQPGGTGAEGGLSAATQVNINTYYGNTQRGFAVNEYSRVG